MGTEGDAAQEARMHREIERLAARQSAWARPLGERIQPVAARVLNDRRPLKDALNGTWLGHPVHPLATDVAIGGATMAAVLDVTGLDRAADLAMATGLAGMVASAATGAADAVDSVGRQRDLITLHAVLNTASLVLYSGSFLARLGPRRGRPLARLLGFGGFAVLTASAYVGGDIAYRTGSQVDRHAFDHGKDDWQPIDVADVPARSPIRAMAGSRPLLLYRDAEDAPIQAIDATCSHAGGPLHKGAIEDGCVTCPWHGSVFRLSDGHVVHGPAVYDQPAYEVRTTLDGTLQARRRTDAG
jgi:nitrite reductase/ring-hydroxylating ferredoxin subunit/uncharacterized membrane protein